MGTLTPEDLQVLIIIEKESHSEDSLENPKKRFGTI